MCSFIVVSLLLARRSFFKRVGMQDPFKRFRQAFFNLRPEVCSNLWWVTYPKTEFFRYVYPKLFHKMNWNTFWIVLFIFIFTYNIFYDFFIVIYPKWKIRVSDWPITHCISMYLCTWRYFLFTFRQSLQLLCPCCQKQELSAILIGFGH